MRLWSSSVINKIFLVVYLLSMTLIKAEGEFRAPENFVDSTGLTTTQHATLPVNTLVEQSDKIINNIFVEGNKQVPTQAILSRLPRKGELLTPQLKRNIISNLYFGFKRFKNITLYGEDVGDNRINVIIVVEEKNILKDVVFEGNKQLSEKELRTKTNLADVPAIDEKELEKYAKIVKKAYVDKGYHLADVTSKLLLDKENRATALFKIKEQRPSLVKRIRFTGNKTFTGKRLRSVMYTREDWIMGLLDKSGTYQPDRIEADKHMLEQFYQNNGFMNAKILDARIDTDPETKHMTVTYDIQEGDRYTIKEIKASGNGILSDNFLVSVLPMRSGDHYSREAIIESIKALEFIWGDLGHIYAHIEPSIQPDEETKTVNIAFFSEIGKPVHLNKLTVKGNRKTRDNVIRRQILLEEGDLITNKKMEFSKNKLEGLGYFEQRDGVIWKTVRLTDDVADLDLIVKEGRTGTAHLQLTFGGAELHSSSASVSVEGNIADTNLFGSGVRASLTGRVGNGEKTVIFNVTEPWLFDRPIFCAMDIFHKRVNYEEIRLTQPVNEKHTGAAVTTGFALGPRYELLQDTFFRFNVSIDDIRYEDKDLSCTNTCTSCPKFHATIPYLTGNEKITAEKEYNNVLQKLFAPSAFVSLNMQMGQDLRNHPMHPSRGHSWLSRMQFALPSFTSSTGFYKFDLDANWFTPLIGERDLVLRLHGYFGVVTPFKCRCIPYRELFHIGGPANVRGFLFGQIGPQFAVQTRDHYMSDSIGSQKAFFVNAELVFPIMQDFSMKGLVFYDGGAGWDNPFANEISAKFLKNNTFHYRHAIGVGIRLLNPAPIKVDWGFKLDKRKGESAHEVHFGMSYDW